MAAKPSLAELRELGLEFLCNGLRDVARTARTLLLVTVLPLIEISIGTGQTQAHRHRVDQHLEPFAQLDFGAATAVGGLDDGRNVFPVKNLIFATARISQKSPTTLPSSSISMLRAAGLLRQARGRQAVGHIAR